MTGSVGQVDAFLTALDEAKALTGFNCYKFDIPFIHRQFNVCPPHRTVPYHGFLRP